MTKGTTPLGELALALAAGADALEVPRDATLLLAVSGGADSMAMLYGAAELVRSGRRDWTLTVAHLDHALRPESRDDAAFVTEVASSLEIPVELRRVDVAALAGGNTGLEAAGREARYAFFEEVAPAESLVATAHTADDAAETVLMNLLRGSGLAGASGIPPRRGRIIRPLLGARRAELRRLLDEAGLAYRDDPSNADPSFLRNRVRAELLPLLEELRPGAVNAISRHASLAAADDRLLDALAGEELTRRRGPDGEIDWSEPPDRALGRRIVRLAVGDPSPSAERVEAVLDAAEGPRGGLMLELGGGRVAEVRERRITVR